MEVDDQAYGLQTLLQEHEGSFEGLTPTQQRPVIHIPYVPVQVPRAGPDGIVYVV